MECSICSECFSNDIRLPKCLPCGHTVCSSCLANMRSESVQVEMDQAAKYTIRCPNCRKTFAFKDLDDFPTNFIIIGESSDESSKKQKGAKQAAFNITCKRHPDRMAKLVCMDCKVTLCGACTVEAFKCKDHASHVIKDVAEALALVEEEKQKVIAAISVELEEGYQRKYKEFSDSLKLEREAVVRKAKEIKAQVSEWEHVMSQYIESAGNDMYNRLAAEHKEVINTHLQEVEAIQQMGLFDTSSIQQYYPSEYIKKAMARLKETICRVGLVTEDLELIGAGIEKIKKDTSQVRGNTPPH